MSQKSFHLLLLAGLIADAALAQSAATLTLAGSCYQLNIPYVESTDANRAAYSVRFNAERLGEFLIDPASIRSLPTGTAAASTATFSATGGSLRIDLPTVEFAAGETTYRYAAALSSSDGVLFRVERAVAGPAWGSGGGSCRPVTYAAPAQSVLSGALKIEFEDISQAEGMMHTRFANVSSSPLYLSLDVASVDGRVGLMAPQAGLLFLDPGESLVGYVLYYSTGAAGAASYRTRFSFAGLDRASGKPNGIADSIERTVTFVRPGEVPLVVSDAATQVAYARTVQVSSRVGFWRYKVDDAERRIVLFPGQENWSDPAAASSAKVLAHDLDGRLLWEFSPGTETWGGDASADGRYVAMATVASVGASSRLILLDAATGGLLRELTLSANSLPQPAGAVPPTRAELDAREVRFSPDAALIAVGTAEGRGYLFETATLTPRYAVQTEGQLRAIEFRGEHLYYGAGDGLLYKTKIADGTTVWKAYTTAWPYSEPAFSPDGKRLVVGAKSGGFVVLDAESGGCVFSANHGTVRRAFFTPDGQHVVAATGAPSTGTIGYRVADWQAAWRGPMSAAASVTADSRYVFSADGKGALMDRESGKRVATLDPGFADNANYFKTAYISRDGSRAVIARRDLTPGDVAIAFFRRQ